MDDTLNFTTTLAQTTGQLLLKYYHNTNARLKADKTVITEGDLAADRHITQAIRAEFPNDHIISEERQTNYPEHAPVTWIIDPLDGTTNFSLGVHYWGVSIARIVDGFPDTAALYFPIFNELYSAQRGAGAFLNGNRLHLPGLDDQPAALFLCCSRTHRQYNVRVRAKPRIIGSAAYTFCGVASGTAIVGFECTPKIWDIAASWLVLTEAGGALESYENAPFPMQPGEDYNGASFPMLGAISQKKLDTARDRITKKN